MAGMDLEIIQAILEEVKNIRQVVKERASNVSLKELSSSGGGNQKSLGSMIGDDSINGEWKYAQSRSSLGGGQAGIPDFLSARFSVGGRGGSGGMGIGGGGQRAIGSTSPLGTWGGDSLPVEHEGAYKKSDFLSGLAYGGLGKFNSRLMGIGAPETSDGMIGSRIGSKIKGAADAIIEVGTDFVKRTAFNAISNNLANGGNFGDSIAAAALDAATYIPIIGKSFANVADPINRAFDRSSALAGILGRGGQTNIEESMKLVREQFTKEEFWAQSNVMREDIARDQYKAEVGRGQRPGSTQYTAQEEADFAKSSISIRNVGDAINEAQKNR